MKTNARQSGAANRAGFGNRTKRNHGGSCPKAFLLTYHRIASQKWSLKVVLFSPLSPAFWRSRGAGKVILAGRLQAWRGHEWHLRKRLPELEISRSTKLLSELVTIEALWFRNFARIGDQGIKLGSRLNFLPLSRKFFWVESFFNTPRFKRYQD